MDPVPDSSFDQLLAELQGEAFEMYKSTVRRLLDAAQADNSVRVAQLVSTQTETYRVWCNELSPPEPSKKFRGDGLTPLGFGNGQSEFFDRFETMFDRLIDHTARMRAPTAPIAVPAVLPDVFDNFDGTEGV